MRKGKIITVEDGGTVWSIFYKSRKGQANCVHFDWRQLANFYEGTSGRSFYHDYNFGAGRNLIKDYFKGKMIVVEGEEWDKRVRLEE